MEWFDGKRNACFGKDKRGDDKFPKFNYCLPRKTNASVTLALAHLRSELISAWVELAVFDIRNPKV